MARARNIKPGFFKNEDLAECSPWARLCFAGLWTLADREGRLEDRAKRIKGELFAYDSIEVEPLLVELEGRGFLVRYRNLEGSFIQISKFGTHQTPHYSEKPSVIKPPGFQDSKADEKASTPRELQEDSGKVVPIKGGSQPPDSLIPDSLIPEKRDSEVAPSATPPPPPAFDGNNAREIPAKAIVPINAVFELPEEWGIDAEALGFPRGRILNEGERFRQYWVSGKGAGKRKGLRGWRQAWSNWLGKAAERAA